MTFHCAVGFPPPTPKKSWLLIGLLVGRRDELEPLAQGVAERLGQRVDVPQDDVEGEGELLHVGADLRQLPGALEDGHLDVQDGVLQGDKLQSDAGPPLRY